MLPSFPKNAQNACCQNCGFNAMNVTNMIAHLPNVHLKIHHGNHTQDFRLGTELTNEITGFLRVLAFENKPQGRDRRKEMPL
jgi:hypothetical protein